MKTLDEIISRIEELTTELDEVNKIDKGGLGPGLEKLRIKSEIKSLRWVILDLKSL